MKFHRMLRTRSEVVIINRNPEFSTFDEIFFTSIFTSFDMALNTQPADITWNLLGMMNNAWYRVKLEVQPVGHVPSIVFKHPVQAGSMGGGWMQQPRGAPSRFSTSATAYRSTKEFTLAEVQKHNKPDDCWIIVNGEVIDATTYLRDHPGGRAAIMVYAGADASAAFHDVHAPDALEVSNDAIQIQWT